MFTEFYRVFMGNSHCMASNEQEIGRISCYPSSFTSVFTGSSFCWCCFVFREGTTDFLLLIWLDEFFFYEAIPIIFLVSKAQEELSTQCYRDYRFLPSFHSFHSFPVSHRVLLDHLFVVVVFIFMEGTRDLTFAASELGGCRFVEWIVAERLCQHGAEVNTRIGS